MCLISSQTTELCNDLDETTGFGEMEGIPMGNLDKHADYFETLFSTQAVHNTEELQERGGECNL